MRRISSLASRLLITAVMGVFFFVQVQSSFMFCAYGYDYAQVSSYSVQNSHSASFFLLRQHTGGQQAGFKLNKRYQAVTPYALVPAPVTIAVHQCRVRAKWLVPPVLASTHFLYTKPLRGPPVV